MADCDIDAKLNGRRVCHNIFRTGTGDISSGGVRVGDLVRFQVGEHFLTIKTNNLITTLYKRAKSTKIQVWMIEVKGNRYRSISGEDGGAMTTSTWTTVAGKNIGRANETTPDQQAALEAEAKITLKLKSGYSRDKETVDAAAKKIEPMLAKLWGDYRDKTIHLPLGTQPKLDGIRAVGTEEGLFSREGNQFVSCPHIEAEVKAILALLPEGTKLDGELYNHEFKDDFNQIVHLVKRQKPTPDDWQETEKFVQYHIYDIDMPSVSFVGRHRLMQQIAEAGTKYIHLVETVFISEATLDAVQTKLDELYGGWMEQGYEGQMIRVVDRYYENKRTKFLLKRKEFIDGEFVITDITEGKGNRSGMAGRAHFRTPEGKDFEAGLRGKREYFTELLKNKDNYIGKPATVRYQNLTPDGKPRFAVMIAIRDYE